MKILVVEDEEEVLNTISNYFKGEDFHCEYVSNLKNTRSLLDKEVFDFFIIDVDLPDGSGLELIKEIKEVQPESFIIIISTKHSTENKVDVLNMGADDYLTNLFDMSELHARINSLLRRFRFEPLEKKYIEFNEIKIKSDTYQVFVHDVELLLTPKEYDLLLYFINNKNRVVSKLSIVEVLWGNYEEYNDSFDFLYAQIKNLRKKIAGAGGNDYLQNIYRIGYKFRSY